MRAVFVCAAIAAAAAQHASAEIVIHIYDSGGNVEARLSGDFDLRATQGFISTSSAYDGYLPSFGAVAFTSGITDYYGMTQNTWTPLGPGNDFGNWDTSSGDAIALFSNPVLGVPTGYVSGDPLSSSATKFGTTLAALGFAEGVYVTTLTNGNFSDSVRVIIPAPGTAALLGLGGMLAMRRRRA